MSDAGKRSSGDNALDRLLHAPETSVTKLSKSQIRDEVITLILAGHDTTSIALSWTFYLLSEHPEYWVKLRAEWKSIDGTPDSGALLRLPISRGVIKEALRLYPSAYIIGREATRNIALGETIIPKGKAVVISPYVMGRDERYYPDAEKFIPERWTEAFEKQLPRFAFIPFSDGKRVCIGAQFAMLELMYMLWHIGRHWEFQYVGSEPAKPNPILTLIPNGGMPMRCVKSR